MTDENERRLLTAASQKLMEVADVHRGTSRRHRIAPAESSAIIGARTHLAAQRVLHEPPFVEADRGARLHHHRSRAIPETNNMETSPTNIDPSTDWGFRCSTGCQQKDGDEDSVHSFTFTSPRADWMDRFRTVCPDDPT